MSRILYDFLSKRGLLSELHTYVEVSGKKEVSHQFAYCTFYTCHNSSFKRNLKEYQRRCPDCGHELTWTSRLKAREIRRLNIESCKHEWIGERVVDRECSRCGVKKRTWTLGWNYW